MDVDAVFPVKKTRILDKLTLKELFDGPFLWVCCETPLKQTLGLGRRKHITLSLHSSQIKNKPSKIYATP